MNKKTLKALQGSIAKWEGIAAGTGFDNGGTNCPLCKLFVEKRWDCGGCPVAASTGKDACLGTPYTTFARLGSSDVELIHGKGFLAVSDKAKEAAQAEVDFLKSLLPEQSDVR